MKQSMRLLTVGVLVACAAAGAGFAHQAGGSSEAAAAGPAKQQPRTLFALIYRPGPKWQLGKPFREQIAIREHYAYVKELFAQGVVFSGGGMGADHGLVLLYARDQAEADSILAGDPMMQAGSFAGDVRPHTPAFISDKPLTATKQ